MAELASLGRLRYTFAEYEKLLRSLLDDGYAFTDFSSLEADEIVLRHDVDLSPERALEMGRIEAALDVRATYCFLLTTPAYNLLEVEHVNALSELVALGHEVALHFDTHHYWSARPDPDELRTRVRAECDVIGRLLGHEIDVVSFHRPPPWVLDVDFDGFVNTYAPPFFSETTYLSDSSQKWRAESPFPERRPEHLQLLVHPGLWGPDPRRMDDIVAELAVERHAAVDAYLDPMESKA